MSVSLTQLLYVVEILGPIISVPDYQRVQIFHNNKFVDVMLSSLFTSCITISALM